MSLSTLAHKLASVRLYVCILCMSSLYSLNIYECVRNGAIQCHAFACMNNSMQYEYDLEYVQSLYVDDEKCFYEFIQ